METINKLIDMSNQYQCAIAIYMYKQLCAEQTTRMVEIEATKEDIINLSESDSNTVKYFQQNLGYFISYENSFEHWIALHTDFDISNVRDAMHAFSRLTTTKKYDFVFSTLSENLSKLGQTSLEQTEVLSNIIWFVDDLPFSNSEEVTHSLDLIKHMASKVNL
ncbi:hypothetical protein [Aliivibrio fischeri]|uniref:hypothetical protein n=1 Tax=Aliivibrio fischeri TaxID=668 RepID=UPI0007C50BF3|nr:hypothetical protein [Aliivibrio fischeri]